MKTLSEADVAETTPTPIYARLAEPFEQTFRDTRGGVELEYITGEQCISRLNHVLGVNGWSFVVLNHGINQEADEVWVLGALTTTIEGVESVRQQFGSQKVKRSRSSGAPVDIGFDLKGATTDALKKCAMLVGVGLYLSKKEQVAFQPATDGEALICAECGKELIPTTFKDGTSWSPQQLAAFGRRKHQRVLCMDHYRSANELRRRAEQALEEVPF
ncbi:MAG: Rad52/Rad22 family DNA repair protein [Chloroflexota bacterium]